MGYKGAEMGLDLYFPEKAAQVASEIPCCYGVWAKHMRHRKKRLCKAVEFLWICFHSLAWLWLWWNSRHFKVRFSLFPCVSWVSHVPSLLQTIHIGPISYRKCAKSEDLRDTNFPAFLTFCNSPSLLFPALSLSHCRILSEWDLVTSEPFSCPIELVIMEFCLNLLFTFFSSEKYKAQVGLMSKLSWSPTDNLKVGRQLFLKEGRQKGKIK